MLGRWPGYCSITTFPSSTDAQWNMWWQKQRPPISLQSPRPRGDLSFNSDGTSFHTPWKSVTSDARHQGTDELTLVLVMLNNFLEGRSHDPTHLLLHEIFSHSTTTTTTTKKYIYIYCFLKNKEHEDIFSLRKLFWANIFFYPTSPGYPCCLASLQSVYDSLTSHCHSERLERGLQKHTQLGHIAFESLFASLVTMFSF